MAGVRSGIGIDRTGHCQRAASVKLKELGNLAGEMDYPAMSAAVKRFERRLARGAKLRRLVAEIRRNIVEC
jgi:hypothetical protein